MRIKRCYLSYKQAKSTVIRVGDLVVVTVPEFVERVGYPLSFEDAKRWVLDHQYADITRLTGDSNWVYTTQGQRLLSSLAKFYQRRMKFGGRERTLHLYRESDKLGKVYEVIDRKVVTTGTYYNDPPELAGAKKHVLFRLRDPASLLQIRPGSGSSGVISKRCKQGDFYDGRGLNHLSAQYAGATARFRLASIARPREGGAVAARLARSVEVVKEPAWYGERHDRVA